MSKPTFTMMVGLVGSGKSTYAKQLAEETNAIICSSDAIREELCGDENSQKSYCSLQHPYLSISYNVGIYYYHF